MKKTHPSNSKILCTPSAEEDGVITIPVVQIGVGFMGITHQGARDYASQRYQFQDPETPGNNLRYRFKTICVVSRNQDKARQFAADCGAPYYTDDIEAAIGMDEAGLVSDCYPQNMRLEIAEMVAARAAAKKLTYQGEKPLGRNAAEAWKVRNAIVNAGLVNQCAFVWRHLPSHLKAARFLRTGEAGEIFHCWHDFIQSWTVDAGLPFGGNDLHRLEAAVAGDLGVGYDLKTHSIDLATWWTLETLGPILQICGDHDIFTAERVNATKTVEKADGEQDGPTEVAKEKIGAADFTFLFGRFANGGRDGNGATISSMDTRYATGDSCKFLNQVCGENGAVRTNMDESVNHLWVCKPTESEWTHGWTKLEASGMDEYGARDLRPGLGVGVLGAFARQEACLAAAHLKKTNPFLVEWLGEKRADPDLDEAMIAHCVVDTVRTAKETGKWVPVDYGVLTETVLKPWADKIAAAANG